MNLMRQLHNEHNFDALSTIRHADYDDKGLVAEVFSETKWHVSLSVSVVTDWCTHSKRQMSCTSQGRHMYQLVIAKLMHPNICSHVRRNCLWPAVHLQHLLV